MYLVDYMIYCCNIENLDKGIAKIYLQNVVMIKNIIK